ncbi:Acyl CoA acyltransferase-like protein, partial [Metarhizium majus ARSEF 297]
MATKVSTDAAGEDLVCARATPKQITRHFENTSQMWAAPLSLPQYLHMQKQLAKSAEDVATTQYWVLFKPSDPDTVMSSCSVYLREAIVNSGRGMEPVKAAVITDIFTHSEFRRNGMATRLLTKVKEVLDGMEEERKPQTVHQQRISYTSKYVVKPPDEEEVRTLSPEDLAELCLQEVNTAKLRLSALRATQKTFAQVLGTNDVLKWHFVRSLILRRHLGSTKSQEKMAMNGVLYQSSRGITAWAWWVHDYRSRKLFIGQIGTARLQGMEEPIAKILHVAVAEACAYGLREVVMWEPTTQVAEAGGLLANRLGAGVQVIFKERFDDIPCVRLHEQNEREAALVSPEFYTWC